jgi:cysteine desulfuration protein SufE
MNTLDLIAKLQLTTDWEAKYRIILDLAETLPPMPPHLKSETNRVTACTNNTWVAAHLAPDGTIQAHADSDSQIVRGLLAIIIAIANNKTPSQLHQANVPGLLHSLDLDRHLSPSRNNAIHGIVVKLQSLTGTNP